MKRTLLVGILPIFLQSSLEGMAPSLSLWNVTEDFLLKQLSTMGSNGASHYLIDKINNLTPGVNRALFEHLIRRTDILWRHFVEYKEFKNEEKGPIREIGAIAFTPDSEYILTASADGRIVARAIETGDICAEYRGHQAARISSLTVAPTTGGQTFFILSSSYDKTAKIWDSKTGAILKEFVHTSAVLSAVADEQWQYILTTCSDNKVYLWEYETGQCIGVFDGSFKRISSISFAAQGQLVVAVGLGLTGPYKLCLWQRTTGREMKIYGGERLESFSACAFTADGNYALKGSRSEGVSVWDLAQGTQRKEFVFHHALSLAISEDKRYFATAAYGELYLWDHCGTLIRKLQEQKNLPLAVAISRDNASLMTGSSDGIVRLWTCKSTIKDLCRFERALLVNILSRLQSTQSVVSHATWGPLWGALPGTMQGNLKKVFDKECPVAEYDKASATPPSRE